MILGAKQGPADSPALAHLAAALAAAAAAAKTKRRAPSRASAAAHNKTQLDRQRLVSAGHIVCGAGAHVGLAAGCGHMSATRSQPGGMSLANVISAQGAHSAHPNAPVQQPAESANEMDFIKSASRTHSWHWNEKDRSHEVRSSSKL